MAVKRYRDTEWGTTKRIVWGGAHKHTATVYWKEIDGRWVEILDPLKVPKEVRQYFKRGDG